MREETRKRAREPRVSKPHGAATAESKDDEAGNPNAAPSQLGAVVQGFKALADPARLRLLGLLAERERSGQELAALLKLSAPTISHHLKLLKSAGFVREIRHAPFIYYELDQKGLQASIEPVAKRARVQEFAAPTDMASEVRRVLNAFFEGPRLKAMPAQRRKKEIVLEELLKRLPRKKAYSEAELSLWLKSVHEDYCLIRREFLIGGYMIREEHVFRMTEKGREAAGRRRSEEG